jgi:hypothetical protein
MGSNILLTTVLSNPVYVLPSSETKFHTHTKLQAEDERF